MRCSTVTTIAVTAAIALPALAAPIPDVPSFYDLAERDVSETDLWDRTFGSDEEFALYSRGVRNGGGQPQPPPTIFRPEHEGHQRRSRSDEEIDLFARKVSSGEQPRPPPTIFRPEHEGHQRLSRSDEEIDLFARRVNGEQPHPSPTFPRPPSERGGQHGRRSMSELLARMYMGAEFDELD
ncbi:hypothetical protein DAEQUDRAFT_768649 [Daedalea quercina L-15889]|uniref:Uncharacterized protein n=1 Tax=Daedalea quercina L-15889 TaxID=1314783 RepID=A0A165MHZ2_9APHY|nr:hypothetical protein DAEQUDRAFT_768649 [Daedalea quercina L-15889]